MRIGIFLIILFSILPSISSAFEPMNFVSAPRTATIQWNFDGTVDVDLISACNIPDFDKTANTYLCIVKMDGIELTLKAPRVYGSGYNSNFRYNYSPNETLKGPVKDLYSSYELPGQPVVTSNLPIVKIYSGSPFETKEGYNYQPAVIKNGNSEKCQTLTNAAVRAFEIEGLHQVNMSGCQNVVVGLRLSLAPAESVMMYRNLSSAYSVGLKNILYTLNELSSFVRRSDRAHLVRLQQSLEAAILLTEGSEANPNLPLVHHRVTESLRLVVVMGTVLDELFSEYEDIKTIQSHIAFLRKFINSTREAYGWDQGLAGAPSQSIAAISTVLELEFRELFSMKSAAATAQELAIYGKLRMASIELKAISRSRAGGDVAAARKMTTFVELWNSAVWQAELRALLNAGPDLQNLVQPKLKLLLMATESLADLTEEKLEIPDGVLK